MERTHGRFFFVLSALVFSSSLAMASKSDEVVFAPWTSLAPGISFTGALGNVNAVWGDALVPIIQFSPGSFWYVDPQALYHSNQEYSGSIGTGFRMLSDKMGILGVYVFGDYNHSRQGHSFWFVSPGIERLGDTFDFSLNTYIPVSTSRIDTGAEFASALGNYNSVVFSGHNEFDQIVNMFESTGVGIDGEIGYRLPFLKNNTKFYAGIYYFAPKDAGSITGGTVRLEAPLNNFVSASVSDAYDNISHNTVKFAISLSLWGRSTHADDYSLPGRLVDPIQRNRIAREGSSHTAQYIAQGEEFTGQLGLVMSNIWFFSPNGTDFTFAPSTSTITITEDMCTAQQPCSSNDVNSSFLAGINAIAPQANLFLAPGTYNNINNSLVMNNGQSIYGRTSNYTQAAQGENRPLLVGGLDLFGNNRIDSLILTNDSLNPIAQAVLVENNAQTITLNNLLLGNSGDDPSGAYLTGILLNGNSQINVLNSIVNVFTETTSSITGMQANGSGNTITLTDSTISGTVLNNATSIVTGIINNGSQNNWTITNSQISAFSETGTPNGIIENGSNNQWSLNNNQITTTTYSTNGAIYGNGILTSGSTTGDTWNLTNNIITVSAPQGPEAIFDQSSHSTWNLNGNQFINTDTAFDTVTYGILAYGNYNTWNLANNTFDISFTGTNSTEIIGFEVDGSNNSINLTQNTFNVSANGLAIGINSAGSNNSWALTGNTLLVTATTSNSTSVAISNFFATDTIFTLTNNTIVATSAGQAVGIENNGSTALWQLTNNQITAISSGNSTSAIGILTENATTQWSLSSNTIQATTSGTDSIAYGISAGGNSVHITSSNDTIIANATGSGTSNAFGVSANNAESGGTTNSMFSFTDAHIQASSANGNATGLSDPTTGGSDIWLFDSATFAQITVLAPHGTACKVNTPGHVMDCS